MEEGETIYLFVRVLYIMSIVFQSCQEEIFLG